MNKRFIFILALSLLVIYFAHSPNTLLGLRSYIIMYPYSYKHKTESILSKKNVDLYIPGGTITREKDWYPFIMTFNDDKGFSKYTGKDLNLTILYNFGHFEYSEGASSYYNPYSPYYSSFYGGYAIYNNEVPEEGFGFDKNGNINIEELSLIPKYDQTALVLPSIGCPRDRIIFEAKVDAISKDVEYMGIKGWVKVDSTIITNSPIHKYKENHRGYIQFGRPNDSYYSGEDFPVIQLKGRIYVKYIDKYNMTFVLYVMAPNMTTVENCDKKILSKSRIIDLLHTQSSNKK